MALHTLGTKGASQLACLAGYSAILPAADITTSNTAITNDRWHGQSVAGALANVSAVQATATTAGTNQLTVVTARANSPPITTIAVRDIVLGAPVDIVPGTFVSAISGTTVTLSQPAISTGTLKVVAFVRFVAGADGVSPSGFLDVPRRGRLQILPGDVVAWDALGFPILVSANSITYAGSDWQFT